MHEPVVDQHSFFALLKDNAVHAERLIEIEAIREINPLHLRDFPARGRQTNLWSVLDAFLCKISIPGCEEIQAGFL